MSESNPTILSVPTGQPAPSYAPDVIEISALSVRAILGIYEFERDQRQEVVLNLRLFTDVSSAARSDSIEDALDYKAVTKRVLSFVEESSFFLIEKLIEAVATLILTEFRVPRVAVSIEKPGALRFAETVGISITRERKDAGDA